MQKVTLRILIGFITFALGLSAVFLTDSRLVAHNESVFLVEAVYKAETGIPRFMPTGRGCGQGYSQGYVSDDDRPAMTFRQE